MTAGTPRLYARSLLANWIGHVSNVIVMLLLSPFVVHQLGKTGYGVWSLLMTLTGYLGLAELGVRVSTGRFLYYYMGRGDQENVDRVACTSLAFYSAVGLLLMIIALVLGAAVGALFPRIPMELRDEARWVLLLTAFNAWMGFLANVFGQLLQATNRFDLRNVAIISVLVVRAVGTVVALSLGGGLVALAGVLTLSSFLSLVLFVAFARTKGAPVHLARRHLSWRTFSEVIRYGGWAFLQNASGRIIAYSNSIIIAVLLGMEQVAIYSVAMVLADGAGDFLGHVFRVLVPDVTQAAGRGDIAALRWYVLRSTRVTLVLAMPLLLGLAMLGPQFIRLWMGPGFETSGAVLPVLVVFYSVTVLCWAPSQSLNALGHVRVTALMGLGEAVLNVVGAVSLVLMGWGLYGVAAGVTIPALLFGFGMLYMNKRYLALPARAFLGSLAGPGLVCAAVSVPACALALRWATLDTWRSFLLTAAVLAAAYSPIAAIIWGGRRPKRLVPQFLRPKAQTEGVK